MLPRNEVLKTLDTHMRQLYVDNGHFPTYDTYHCMIRQNKSEQSRHHEVDTYCLQSDKACVTKERENVQKGRNKQARTGSVPVSLPRDRLHG